MRLARGCGQRTADHSMEAGRKRSGVSVCVNRVGRADRRRAPWIGILFPGAGRPLGGFRMQRRDKSHRNLESAFGLWSGGWVRVEAGQVDGMESILQVEFTQAGEGWKRSLGSCAGLPAWTATALGGEGKENHIHFLWPFCARAASRVPHVILTTIPGGREGGMGASVSRPGSQWSAVIHSRSGREGKEPGFEPRSKLFKPREPGHWWGDPP